MALSTPVNPVTRNQGGPSSLTHLAVNWDNKLFLSSAALTKSEGNLLVVGHASARKKQAHLNIRNPDGHFRSLPNAGLFLEADSRNTQTNQQEQMPTHPPLWSSPEQNIEGLPSALWQRKQLPTDIGTNCRGTKSNYELRYTPSFLCCQVSSSSRFVNFNQAQCSFNT